MIPLNQMTEHEQNLFLREALEDAGESLRRKGFPEEGARYINYIREIRGEQQEASHG
ncbi:hypothetical protein [Acidovorax sp.]|uniref:hypothetical protein n=1 Tax=Acidovorax sp. TaxID=1872122 RepID=UPI0031DEFE29